MWVPKNLQPLHKGSKGMQAHPWTKANGLTQHLPANLFRASHLSLFEVVHHSVPSLDLNALGWCFDLFGQFYSSTFNLCCNWKSNRSWSILWSSFQCLRKSIHFSNRCPRLNGWRQFLEHLPPQRFCTSCRQELRSTSLCLTVRPARKRTRLLLFLPNTKRCSGESRLDSSSEITSTFLKKWAPSEPDAI